MEQKKVKKIAVIVTHPIQYHTVIWRGMSNVPGWKVDVMFCSDHGQRESFDKEFGHAFKWNIDLTSGYEHAYYKNSALARKAGFFRYINWGILKRILTTDYDFIYIHGVGYFTHMMGLILGRLTGKKIILRNISYNLDAISGKKRLLKKLIYVPLYKLPNYCIYIGRHNYNYYKEYRVPDRRLVHILHIIDNEFFKQQKQQLSGKAGEIKQSFGFDPNDKIILFCGKLFSKKQPLLLLEAFKLANTPPNWKLLFVGTGEDEQRLRQLATTSGKGVGFAGFMNQNEIARAYCSADILALPSKFGETWGLVVNEALNFDCAIIVSNKVGCAPELVENKTGLVVPYNSLPELTKAIEELVNDDEQRKRFQQQAAAVISECSIENFIVKLKRIIDKHD